jgi:hypothetical protein
MRLCIHIAWKSMDLDVNAEVIGHVKFIIGSLLCIPVLYGHSNSFLFQVFKYFFCKKPIYSTAENKEWIAKYGCTNQEEDEVQI